MARTTNCLANAARLLARLGAGLGIVSLLGGSSLLAMAEVVEDAGLPSDVENLQGFPGDGEATLTWDASTDDTGVEGYYVYAGLESVEANGGSYTFGSTDAGDSTTYIMDNLTNGVTYYFTVTAYDADGNEAQYYSKEVEVTPEASELGDFTAPTVKNASASTSTLVEVEFSEAVELPTDSTSAFALESTSGTAIEVLDAYVSSDAPSTVFVVTAEQTAGTQYILTAGIGITDLAGNTIESGTSDTAIFTGSSLQKTEGDTTGTETDSGTSSSDTFMVDQVEATDVNELVLTFTQAVVSADPDSFTIQAADDATQIVDVLAVSIDDQDSTLVTLTTEDMESGFDYVLTMDEMIFNTDGASLAEENMSVEFTAKTKDLADVVAPEDITDFLAAVAEETSVMLSWTASEDTAGDLAKYLVYQSLDGGLTFGDALSVASDAVDYEVTDLTAGETYTFKVTAVDENGNESEGVLTTVTLPEAGPELLVLGALSFFGAGAWTRKKKKD